MKYLLGIIILFTLSSCVVSYNANEVLEGTNKQLPKEIGLDVAGLNLAKLKTFKLESVQINEQDQRMDFTFVSKIETPLKNFECKKFRVSAIPVLKDGVVLMTEGRAEDINCGGIPATDLVNLIKEKFFSELVIETVKLEGMKKSLAKKIYLEGNEIKVSWGIF